MFNSFGFELIFKIFNFSAVLITIIYISNSNKKVLTGKITLPLVLGLFWIAITGVLQFVLYHYFGQSHWAARISEITGLIGLIGLGAHISYSDQISPIWRFLIFIDRYTGIG